MSEVAEVQTISGDDWAKYHQRRGSQPVGFGDVRSLVSGAADGGDDKPTSGKQSGEGDGDPKNEKPGEGDDNPNEQESVEGEEGGPKKEKPEGDEKANQQKASGFQKRLARMNRRHEAALTAEREKREALEAQLAAARTQERKPDDEPPEGSGKEAPPENAVEAEYEALGIQDLGPDPEDYKDNPAHFNEDYDLWIDEKPLKHHPKLAEAKAAAAKKAQERESSAREEKPDGKKAPEKTDTTAAQTRANQLYALIDARFEEAEEADAETPLNGDLQDTFVEDLQQKRYAVSMTMLEHIADSDDGLEIIEMLTKQRSTALRIFAKPDADQAAALDAALKTRRSKIEKAGKKGDEQETRKAGPGGKVMPDPPGGGNKTGEVDYSQMSQDEYVAQRRREREQKRGNSKFFHLT